MAQINEKEQLFRSLLKHPKIEEIRGRGLMLAPILSNDIDVAKVVHRCSEKGLILFFLLWEKRALRISPPLTISKKKLRKDVALSLMC